MTVYLVILGSGWIALGAWTAARAAISLTRGRATPEMTKPGSRQIRWQALCGSVSNFILGYIFVTDSLRSDAARWLLAIAGTALLIWLVISADVGSWRTLRRRRKPAQQQT